MSVKGVSPRPIVMILSPTADDEMTSKPHVSAMGMTGMGQHSGFGFSNLPFSGIPRRPSNNSYDMSGLADARAVMASMNAMAQKLGFSGLSKKDCCAPPSGMSVSDMA
jgi:hypothetical protein